MTRGHGVNPQVRLKMQSEGGRLSGFLVLVELLEYM